MNLSLAVAILDENLKGPTATFDEMGLNAVRWAWETVKADLPPAEAPCPICENTGRATWLDDCQECAPKDGTTERQPEPREEPLSKDTQP